MQGPWHLSTWTGKYGCTECGGSHVCQHGRNKYRCRDCGLGLCAHARRRSRCKDCGGAGLCKHGRERGRCKDCGGSGMCIHGRQRPHCKLCGGSAFCLHGQIKGICKDCGGKGRDRALRRWKRNGEAKKAEKGGKAARAPKQRLEETDPDCTVTTMPQQVWGTWRLAFCFPGQVWGRLWSGAAALFGLERQSRLREEVNSYQVIDSCVSVTLFLFERSALRGPKMARFLRRRRR